MTETPKPRPGRPLSGSDKKFTRNVTFSPEMSEYIDRKMQETGLSMSEIIRVSLSDFETVEKNAQIRLLKMMLDKMDRESEEYDGVDAHGIVEQELDNLIHPPEYWETLEESLKK